MYFSTKKTKIWTFEFFFVLKTFKNLGCYNYNPFLQLACDKLSAKYLYLSQLTYLT